MNAQSNTGPDSEQAPEESAEEHTAVETTAAEAGTEPADAPGGEPEGEPPIPSFELNKEPGFAEDERVAELELEVAELKDKMLRAVAEQENVRRRAQKDVENATRRSIKTFAGDLLAVADNLRRAIDSVDDDTRKAHPAIENVLIGVDMTERELMAAFARHGITQMQPVGERFDPNFHEAMFEYDDPSQPAGTVGQVIETGYAIQGQPLRAAKVGVTKGGPKPEAAAPAGEPVKPGADTEPGSHIDENL